MGNFFSELFSAERCILADPFIGHDDASYTPETKAVLVRLIQSVVSGRYFPQSEASRYVCKNFRLGASELTKHYNATHDVSKEVSTFRCQISLASEKLYHLFGHGIYQAFMSQDSAKLQRIDNIITLLEMEDYQFADVFFEEVSGACDGYSGVGFALSECTSELDFLKNIVRFRLLSEMNDLNLAKLRYLKYILDEPIVNYKNLQLNKKKASILVALGVPALVLENTT